jgi:hypothetical protein
LKPAIDTTARNTKAFVECSAAAATFENDAGARDPAAMLLGSVDG